MRLSLGAADKAAILSPTEGQKTALACGFLLSVVLMVAFATGALRLKTSADRAQLWAYDSLGAARFCLTISCQERPDIAFFSSGGRRLEIP